MTRIPVIYLPDLDAQQDLFALLYARGGSYLGRPYVDGWDMWLDRAKGDVIGYPHVYIDSMKRIYSYRFNADQWAKLEGNTWTIVNSPRHMIRYAKAHIFV